MSSKTYPTLEVEHRLLAGGARFIIGVDEVGRGSIAGPVAVGVCLLDSQGSTFLQPWPAKLQDSKLLSEKTRIDLVPALDSWAAAYAVGFASALEIDEKGIVVALALAAGRALESMLADENLRGQIAQDGAMILLDGSHNWLGAKASGIPVEVLAKADLNCVSVAAASVFAKVERDSFMISLASDFGHYGFEGHKGYASEQHILAVREHGPSEQHRLTWLTKILAGSKFDPFLSDDVLSETVVVD
jgi:ribonuclease HII